MHGSACVGRRTAAAFVTVMTALALPACEGGQTAQDGDAPAPGGQDTARTSGATSGAGSGSAAATGGFPEGWKLRTDPGDTTPDAVELAVTDDGYRVRPGPRAVYWDPEMEADGTYRFSATFRHFNEPEPPEAYGLFVGGRDLTSSRQDYLYFLVRRDGKFLVKRRDGEETRTLTDWTAHDAVETGPAEGGSPPNTLAVESREDAVRFLVNGTEVDRLSRSGAPNTDGQVGVRVNHRLEVLFTEPRLEPLADSGDGGGG